MSLKSDKKDSLGERMKDYESGNAGRFMPMLPVLVRLDGCAFHTFTRGLKRPYDERLSKIMIETTRELVKKTNACIGYTQSDEISLVLYSESAESQIYFDGKISKIISTLAATTSVLFNKLMLQYLPEKADSDPVFDCRAFQVPNKVEAVNALLWREKDAIRNSVSMAAQSYYSHKELHKKSCAEMHDMLYAKGINFNNYPQFFKNGSYIQRKISTRKFTVEEANKLPKKHAYFTNPDLAIERKDCVEIDMILGRVQNKIDVVFNGVDVVNKVEA
jgi:tRNA(His) 5'-end guanylyltransferase